MILNVVCFLAGAVVFGFVLRNNPSLAKKLRIVSDRIVEIVDVKNAEEETKK